MCSKHLLKPGALENANANVSANANANIDMSKGVQQMISGTSAMNAEMETDMNVAKEMEMEVAAAEMEKATPRWLLLNKGIKAICTKS